MKYEHAAAKEQKPGMTALEQRKVPVTMMPNRVFHLSSGNSVTGAMYLLTTSKRYQQAVDIIWAGGVLQSAIVDED